MCKIYNSLGSLTELKNHLKQNNIQEFKSLKDVITFQRDFTTNCQKIISSHEILIEQEKHTLAIDIPQLAASIEAEKTDVAKKIDSEIELLTQQLDDLLFSSPENLFQRICTFFKTKVLKKKLVNRKHSKTTEIENAVHQSVDTLNAKAERHKLITLDFELALAESSACQLNELKRKKRVVDEVNSLIYGALGENKVQRKLESLSDDYYLLNDFYYSFNRPLYNPQEKNYIKTVQIDHLLVSPAGIFLIETKNWSEKSLNNPDLWSPVQQIKRVSFALFKMLNQCRIQLLQHKWGNRKIPIKNLLVFTNHRPEAEFEHIKILTVNHLVGYIKYFKPVFSNKETEQIVSYLLGLMRSSSGRYDFDAF